VSSADPQDQVIADLPGRLPFIITQQLGGPSAAGAVQAPAAPAMDKYFREVLGWMPRVEPREEDVQAFVNALSRHFSVVTVEGVDKWVYTPYGGAVPSERADLSITGAQASLYSRAASAEGEIQELLDSLYPLSEIADKEQAEAVKAILSLLVKQLREALGAEGGPSALLVDGFWAQLLDVGIDDPPPDDPETVEGVIGDLRERFYLTRDRINLPAEEENYTNYLSIFDYLVSLYVSWRIQRPFFTGEVGQPYFGTLLVYLRRALQVITENVDELVQRLDIADIGQAERQNMRVRLDPPQNTWLYLQATLDWIREYASETAPQLIETAGRDGAISTYPTLWNMAEAVEAFVGQPPGFPALYSDPLVQAAAASLATSLDDAVNLVAEIGPPQSVLEIMPRPEQAPSKGLPPEQPRQPTPPKEGPEVEVNLTFLPARSEKLVIQVDGAQKGDRLFLAGADEDPEDPETDTFDGKAGLKRGNAIPFEFDLGQIPIEGDSEVFSVYLSRGDVTQKIDEVQILN
jgi:hypothetical protein